VHSNIYQYVSSESLDGKSLASLTASIIQFQEVIAELIPLALTQFTQEVLGYASKDKVCTRLPVRYLFYYHSASYFVCFLGKY
jgi:hypothetical protein